MSTDEYFLNLAISRAIEGVKKKEGGPFGAVIVMNDAIISIANNRVLASMDPTAHAEIEAIRGACSKLGRYQLEDCTIYASCEPCPMCFGAIYWARPLRLVYAASRHEAAAQGFDDSMIYNEIQMPLINRIIKTVHLKVSNGQKPFEWWEQWGDKQLY